MNLFVIENQDDLRQAEGLSAAADAIFLSASAEASHALMQTKAKFISDENALSPDEFKRIGEENFQLAQEWINSLERKLQEEFPLSAGSGFYPFKWNFFRIKMLLDAVRTKKMIIERLIERFKPSLIVAHTGALPSLIHDFYLFFHRSDSLYGIIVKRVAEEKGIPAKAWEANWFETPGGNPCDWALKQRDNALKLGMLLRLSCGGFLAPKRGKVLLGTIVYDVEHLTRSLSGEFDFYYYKKPSAVFSLRNLSFLKPGYLDPGINGVNPDAAFGNVEVTNDRISDEILGARIDSYARTYIPLLWKELKFLEEIDREHDFKAYVHEAGACDAFHAIPVQHFQQKNKPVIIVQHGAYGYGLNRMTEYCEFAHNGYFFSWGDGIKELYEKRKRGRCEIISTGSPIIDNLRKRARPRPRIRRVCYVPTSYSGYFAYYPNGQPCLDSRKFIMEAGFLKELAPYLGRYEVWYKLPPGAGYSPLFGRNPVFGWLKEFLPGVKVERRALLDVIRDFDLFIIDWPSTSLLQALATYAEVLVYTGNKYFEVSPQAMALLEKRAVVGSDEEDFKRKIRAVLDRGEIVSDTGNTGFLEKYATYLNDGCSLERMRDNFISILNGEPRCRV